MANFSFDIQLPLWPRFHVAFPGIDGVEGEVADTGGKVAADEGLGEGLGGGFGVGGGEDEAVVGGVKAGARVGGHGDRGLMRKGLSLLRGLGRGLDGGQWETRAEAQRPQKHPPRKATLQAAGRFSIANPCLKPKPCGIDGTKFQTFILKPAGSQGETIKRARETSGNP